MGTYYLDIETSGLDEFNSKILTIQWAELERNTGKLIGDVNILKEWESDEKTILEEFVKKTYIFSDNTFNFVVVGYNLKFEHKFLLERSLQHDLFPIRILDQPFIDLFSVGILMNKGEFKGSGLDKITNKPSTGLVILEHYKNKEWDKIEEYIKNETIQFSYFCEWCHQELHKMRKSLNDYLTFRDNNPQ